MPIPFTLRQLEYFVAVAEHGSVTAAAVRKNVSQPSVSVAIADLEAQTGRTLFRRQAGHGLKITAAGRQLLFQARTVLACADEIMGRVRLDAGEQEISIACFRDLGSIYLPKMLTAFAGDDPRIRFRLSEGDLEDVRASILDGRCDLAITYDIGLDRTGVSRSTIDRLLPHVLLSRHHPKAKARKIGLKEIAAERVILEDFPVTRDYFNELFLRNGLSPASIQLAPSFEMQRGLVANGWGIGLSCVRPAPDITYDGASLAYLPLAQPEPAQSVVVAHLGEKTLSQAARRFVEVLKGNAGAQ